MDLRNNNTWHIQYGDRRTAARPQPLTRVLSVTRRLGVTVSGHTDVNWCCSRRSPAAHTGRGLARIVGPVIRSPNTVAHDSQANSHTPSFDRIFPIMLVAVLLLDLRRPPDCVRRGRLRAGLCQTNTLSGRCRWGTSFNNRWPAFRPVHPSSYQYRRSQGRVWSSR